MPYYTDEQIAKARDMDLLTYLRLHDPGELVHVSGNEYCTREHDSLKISNGKWNWWSRGFGGASALDYLVKVKEIPFLQAMGMILDTEGKSPSFFDVKRPEKQVEKRLLLPQKSSCNDQIIRYLSSRGIDREVIESCIREGLLYESLPYHNCIFVGYDHNQVPRYASFRATRPEKIMGEAAGSDKKYAFRIDRAGSTIHVFESAIDLLSFATIMKQRTGEWRAEPMISLGGVYASRRGTQLMKLPVALTKALEFGQFVNEPKPKVENMRIQHAGRVREAQNAAQDETYVRAEPEKPFGFVAVAAGAGLENMFRELGVDCVVRGGQTMNPSTEDILKAIHATPAKNVFVLPNNKNIIMAAEQAVSLADRNVCVLQTRTIPQGMSAMLAFDESLDAEGNRIAMTKAFERVSTGQVTFAARDSELDGHPIKKGEVLALDNGKLAFTDKDLNHAAYKLAKRLVSGDTSFLTVTYGEDVDEETAQKLVDKLQDKYGDKLEVMLVDGGMPVYYYMISAE